MSAYRLTAGPIFELSPFFFDQFSVNLGTPERGPYVPIPIYDAAGESTFERRPFRADPQGLFSIVEAMTHRHGKMAGTDLLKPEGGGHWEVWKVVHDHPERRTSDLAARKMVKTGWWRKEAKDRVEVSVSWPVATVSVSARSDGGGLLHHVSHWSGMNENLNTDAISLTLLSKDGPPSWKDLKIGLAELLPLLSAIHFLASDEKGVRIRSEDPQGWEHCPDHAGGPEAIARLFETAFRRHKAFTAHAVRRIDYQGVAVPLPTIDLRCSPSWNKGPWLLELTNTSSPETGPFVPSFLDLARRVGFGD
jgi:hypothetical protein